MERPIVLSIAGFDPSSGAGVSADVKTCENLGVYCVGALTAITVQTEDSFTSLQWSTSEQIRAQCLALVKRYSVAAIKVGLVQDFIATAELLSELSQYHSAPIVWDPVLSASAGYDFHAPSAHAVERLLSVSTLITPNRQELELLSIDMKSKNSNALKCAILETGCDEDYSDCLHSNGETKLIKGSSKTLVPKHGSGCVHSSVITAALAKGEDLFSAATFAKKYLESFLASSETGLGLHFRSVSA